MIKNDVMQRIDAVGNLAGCFAILQETLAILKNCEITEIKEPESDNKAD